VRIAIDGPSRGSSEHGAPAVAWTFQQAVPRTFSVALGEESDINYFQLLQGCRRQSSQVVGSRRISVRRSASEKAPSLFSRRDRHRKAIYVADPDVILYGWNRLDALADERRRKKTTQSSSYGAPVLPFAGGDLLGLTFVGLGKGGMRSWYFWLSTFGPADSCRIAGAKCGSEFIVRILLRRVSKLPRSRRGPAFRAPGSGRECA